MSDDLRASEPNPREDALRRLLAEAVEPVQPAPGGQARLLAKVRKQRRRAHQGPARLRLAGGVLAATAVLVGGGVYFAGHAGDDNSTASSASGAGASAPSAPVAGPSSAAREAGGAGSPINGSAVTPEQRASSSQDSSGGTTDQRAAPKAVTLVPPDLDGDGVPDSVTIEGSALVAQLSREGLQRVSLPPTGAGARVLGITLLDSASGGQVPVVFIRLQELNGHTQDTIASLVDGRLVVLKLGPTPVVLVRDAGHAYSCAGPLTITEGSSRNYVARGASLVAGDVRLATARPAAPGCDFG